MRNWIVILLVAIVGLAILGFLVDAARAVAGVALVALLIIVAVRWFATRKKS